MNVRPYKIFILLFCLATAAGQPLCAQLGFDLKVDKPAPYDERVLKAEKTPEDKPIKGPKRFFQNLTTHYNYYFNASTKLNEVIDGAKEAFRDDYTALLPFYNYSLDATASSRYQLDSVIYKAQTGIVMHDLRNDWIDNMYLLWGASWFFEKKFDSAALMFQFINYAFAEKEKDGYYRYIGSRMDGNNALTISTKENNKFPKSLVTPPSRNNAFIWQVRTLIELGNLAEAGSLIATLKNDPLFPPRLQDDLEEVQAYWYYKQNVWDSSATHLVKALGQAQTKQERARWEYLAAQMFERTRHYSEAAALYTRAIGHTTDPVMEVYARLNLVRINKDGGENYIDKNIAELLKMARRDKYSEYRDVIYFMAAQMELERNNVAAAQDLLLKGSKYDNGNLTSRNKSYLLIADLSYDQKKYLQAAPFYDSIKLNELLAADVAKVTERKSNLARVVRYSSVIATEDSLQRIAAMPEEERNAFLNRLLKQMKKDGGDDKTFTPGSGFNSPAPDLFASSSQKGDWYFYNTTLKTQGLVQFRQVWGNRPNTDNWRRFSDVNKDLLAKAPNNTRNAAKSMDSANATLASPTLTSLMNGLPLTPAQLQSSNDSISHALFGLGATYLNDMQDYTSAIDAFEKIRSRFPKWNNMSEVLFNLYFAYKKAGNDQKAEQVKKLLTTEYPSSRFATILTTGKDPAATGGRSTESAKAYESIYDLFLEGKFEEAEAAKRIADSTYKTSYWQPQLLYLEAVYQVRQRNDSVAKKILQTIIAQNANSPLAIKATTMIDVLGRRQQIEDELARWQIQTPVDTTARQTVQPPVVQPPVVQATPPPVRKDSIVNRTKDPVVLTPPKTPKDTAAKAPIVQAPPVSVYKFEPTLKHYALVVLDKVDPLFANEAKNAFVRFNRDKYYNQTINLELRDLDADRKLLLIGEFATAQEALDYATNAKRVAASEILPWLKADKYSFGIASNPNLAILQEKKDMVQYRKFLEQFMPGKF